MTAALFDQLLFYLLFLLAHLIEESRLDTEQLVGQVYINLVRICETARLVPEGVLLLCTVVTDFHDTWRRVDTFALEEDRNEEISLIW